MNDPYIYGSHLNKLTTQIFMRNIIELIKTTRSSHISLNISPFFSYLNIITEELNNLI